MVGEMRERFLGIITSVAVHSVIIPLFLWASFAVEKRPFKVVEVDFSLMRGQGGQHASPGMKKEATGRGLPISGGREGRKKTVEPVRHTRMNPDAYPVKEDGEQPPVPTVVTAADAQGETVIHGAAATYADSSAAAGSLQSHGDGDGIPGVGQGGGRDGGQGGGQGNGNGAGHGLLEGGRDYAYIREAIIRHVRYPDEAIRSGIEGKVLLSFIVLESGRTSKIQVVRSSGYRLLDESAKEAVAITRIYRKVPYRVVVHLPVAYKLQG